MVQVQVQMVMGIWQVVDQVALTRLRLLRVFRATHHRRPRPFPQLLPQLDPQAVAVIRWSMGNIIIIRIIHLQPPLLPLLLIKTDIYLIITVNLHPSMLNLVYFISLLSTLY